MSARSGTSALVGLVALVALASSGCYQLTIVNGRQPARSAQMDNRWRSATILDAVDIDGPVTFDALCKETGWAKVTQVHRPLNWAVDLFLAGGIVYESTYVDVYCAAGPVAPVVTGVPAVAPGPGAPPATVTPTPSQPPPGLGAPPATVTPTPSQPPPGPSAPPVSL